MALNDLIATVRKATPVENHSTYRYHVALRYGETTWEVTKRFSEFDQLLQGLEASKYGGLPKLPSKTLLGSPTDTAVIEARKEQLRILLNDLLMRPDTRTSQVLRQFLEVDSNLDEAIKSVQAEAIRTFEDPRFGVSGLTVFQEAKLLVIIHEDSTHLSRLGRVWSVVEPDELGAIHLWSPSGTDGAWKRLMSKTFPIKVRSLCVEATSRQIFLGLEDGKIEVYSVVEKVEANPTTTLQLHHKNPVTHLSATSRKLLSLGIDSAMRIVDIRSHELLCGGRLQKRLRHEGDYLTCGMLDDASDRAFIGTSGGDLFILDVSRNPPCFLHTADAMSKPMAQLLPCQDTIFVAHSDCISALTFESHGSERQTNTKTVYRSKHQHAAETTMLAVAVSLERQLLFGGYSDGCIAFWRFCETEAFAVNQAHAGETTQLFWLPAGSLCRSPMLLSGGGDGKLTMWSLTANPEEYDVIRLESDLSQFAQDFGLAPAAETIGASGELDAFEPSFGMGDGQDVFSTANPRVNPQALRQAGESSDEDNEILNALR